MLTLLAHQRGARDALWSAWSLDPLLLFGLGATAFAFRRSRHRRRPAPFWAALGVLAVALVSPLDAMAGELASAHMVQHVLLIAAAAPLLAACAPTTTILGGLPASVRRTLGGWRRRLPRVGPPAAWALHAATLWFWHASVPYDAALRNDAVHGVEHATFLLSAVLFWSVVLHPHTGRRVSAGFGVLFVFTLAMQNVFLAALLTFASVPWYAAYEATTALWGLDHLADQQLAGVIMWVPAGFVYVGVGVALLARWITESEPDPDPEPQSDFCRVRQPRG